ncbi:MAG: TIGR03936 family radical SAM-associated protein [Thermoguttaceae bacterium]
MVRQRVRIRFCKHGDLRLVGHRDLVRTMERVFRRAELKLGMSEGFHPKPRMSFPSALALGIAGRNEVMELELADHYGDAELFGRLSAATVPGLDFLRVETLPQGAKKAQVRSSWYEMEIPPQRLLQARARVDDLLVAGSCPVERSRGGKTVDPCRCLEHLEIVSDTLRMRLAVLPQGGAAPRDVLAALGLQDLEQEGCRLTRTDVELQT